jgi:hypothetical protein
MTFDANSILASLLVSGVGFVLFEYGRRQHRPPQMISGLTMMVFPYFVPNVLAMLAIGAAIVGAVIVAVRFGW